MSRRYSKRQIFSFRKEISIISPYCCSTLVAQIEKNDAANSFNRVDIWCNASMISTKLSKRFVVNIHCGCFNSIGRKGKYTFGFILNSHSFFSEKQEKKQKILLILGQNDRRGNHDRCVVNIWNRIKRRRLHMYLFFFSSGTL